MRKKINLIYKKHKQIFKHMKLAERPPQFWYRYNLASNILLLNIMDREWIFRKRPIKTVILVGLYLVYVSPNPTYFTLSLLLAVMLLLYVIEIYYGLQYTIRLNLFILDERKLNRNSRILGYFNAKSIGDKIFNFTLFKELQITFYALAYFALLTYILLNIEGILLIIRLIFSLIDMVFIAVFLYIYWGIKNISLRIGSLAKL